LVSLGLPHLPTPIYKKQSKSSPAGVSAPTGRNQTQGKPRKVAYLDRYDFTLAFLAEKGKFEMPLLFG
jgi:hypothetical protein